MDCEGQKRGSSATDQTTALRVRARRGEDWIKHVDKQVREGRKPEKLADDEGQKHEEACEHPCGNQFGYH